MINHGLLTRDDLAWADLDGHEPQPAAGGPRFSLPPQG